MSAEPVHLHVGDEVTLTGTIRTIASLFPQDHVRVTLDIPSPPATTDTELLASVLRTFLMSDEYVGLGDPNGDRTYLTLDGTISVTEAERTAIAAALAQAEETP